MSIHHPSLILAILLVSACAVLSLVFLRLGHRDEPGLGDLTLGVGLQAVGMLLEAVPQTMPVLAKITFGGALMIGGIAYQRSAILRLYRRPVWRWHGPVAILVALAVFPASHFLGSDSHLHHALLGVALCVYTVLITTELFRQAAEEVWAGPRFLCIAVYVFHGLAGLAWTVSNLIDHSQVHLDGVFATPNRGTFYLLASLVVTVFLSFAFSQLMGQRLLYRQRHLALTDLLTGLPNRRGFSEQVHRAFLRAKAAHEHLALLVMDVDHFKNINDRYGHAAGDQALVSFAVCVSACLRESDIAGRIGGEEFAVLLRTTDLQGAMQAAERIRMAVARTPVAYGLHQISLTVSIGVASTQEGLPDLDAFFRLADRRLYQAKEDGRNRVVGIGLETHTALMIPGM